MHAIDKKGFLYYYVQYTIVEFSGQMRLAERCMDSAAVVIRLFAIMLYIDTLSEGCYYGEKDSKA